ncbi:hypothetical protein GEV43_34530 [Actinomadura sp. J1-007]|uniref:hypothetical protein n=1 Tax=Actinomadura sp. J1-007 TaxID=2661913 RepID=UPI00132782AC|nr:hypothetical protein [Actinomadura sp. J1-007]MWK38648.1 hypothetical protein [Actinomadura sp. J1-007]
MGFDEEYHREVLEPARAAGDQPPEDLRVRYALPDPPSAAAVAARVKQVRQCWRRARGQLKYRKLIDRLEAEHRELAAVFAAAERGDLGPLDERLRGGREATRRRLAEARARLADAAGTLRTVTPAEVEGIARTAGVARAELEGLASADRIEVREPDPLPSGSPYPAYRKVRESLDVLGKRHLADFLFGDRLRGPMRVIGGFRAGGGPAGPGGAGALRPGPEAVAEAGAQWARRSRDTSTTHADTVLAALRSGADLDELLLYDVVDRLRERLRQRASERALQRHAMEDLGVEPSDARRLVFAVLRETGPGGGLAGRLRALLDAGEVQAAAELADASGVPAGPGAPPSGAGGDGERPEEEVLAAEARHRLDTALRLRESAVAEDDPDRAWRLLADALRLVRDLPGAAEHQRRLPPYPVPALRADVDGPADGARGPSVRLAWDASPSTAGEVVYHVVRRRGRPPRDAADGEPLPGARDDRPPVNVPLYYGVVAVRGEAAAAPAVAGPVTVRPEPGEVTLTPGDGVVTGRWRCPPEAARVHVVRAGRPVPAGREGFRERVPNGTTHHYRISAVYLDTEGREVATPGVRESVTPCAPPVPVYELAAEPDPSDPGLLRVRFDPPPNGTVELVLTDGPPPWPRSAVVPVEEVRRASRRLAAAPSGGGLEVRPGAGGWLLAVTVAEGTAAIGAYHRHVNLPPPRRLVAERRGAYVHVGFDWPPDVAEAELTWRVGADRIATGRIEAGLVEAGRIEPGRLGSGAPRREIVTRAAYDTQGGVRLPVPEDEPVEVAVASSGTVGGARVTGPAVAAEVPAPTVVHYDLVRSGPPWRRTLTVRLSSARPLRVARLTLVLRAGRVMPHRAADGETLGTWEQVPVPGEVSLPPPGVSGPYWLRCFADDDVVELSDPPVRSLQVQR